MKTAKPILFSILILSHLLALAKSDEDELLIRQTLMDYIQGTANGEPDRLRRAFHPDFNLYSTNQEGDLSVWTGEDYINRIEPGKKANRIGRIVSVDHEGITATAKVEIVVPEWRVFTDYFLLVKYQDQWKIVHKSYSHRPFESDDNAALANSELDTLFSEFNRPDHPAVAALAIHNGKVVYQKAFGSSQLDHAIPATVDTKFQLAGMSKHFTAFAVLLLEEQGRLSLTEDIRNHLPWLPDYDITITVEHLLSMTSGLSDFWDLKNIAGWHRDDVFTQEHAKDIIKAIKPAFAPGTDYLYSNTDQLLLAEIVSAISNKSFSQFMQEEIFTSLGMSNTLVADDFELHIPEMAVSYEPDEENGFKKSAMNYGIYGPTNIYSTVVDLAKWELNLLDPQVGSKDMIARLYEACTTNDGAPQDSWNGRASYAQQFYFDGHGVAEFYQMATLGGHATSIFKFPDQEFTVITLSSGIPYSGYLGMGLADHFIGEHFSEPSEIDFTTLKTKKVKNEQLNKYTGFYWSDKSCFSREIALQNDTLRYMRSDGRSSVLLPLSKNTFQMVVGGGEVVILSFEEAQMNFVSGNVRIDFRRTKKAAYDENELKAFTGLFYSSALNAVYNLVVEEGQFVARHPKAGTIPLRQAMEGSFEGQGVFGSIHFNEDQSGFMLESEDVKGLWFTRMLN